MDLKEAQELARKMRNCLDEKNGKQFQTGSHYLTDLIEEVGELAAAIGRKEIRKVEPKHSIQEELMDVLIDILWLANHYKIDIESELSNTLEKWKERFGFENLK